MPHKTVYSPTDQRLLQQGSFIYLRSHLKARRPKKRKVVARMYERIRWHRTNFPHQHSRKVINSFGTVCVEDLHVNRMVHNHCLTKSITDAAWSIFFSMLSCKANPLARGYPAGRTFIKVNPAYTSQTCSSCYQRQKMPLIERIFSCPCCQLYIDRDLNAALNIKAVGLHSVGLPQDALGLPNRATSCSRGSNHLGMLHFACALIVFRNLCFLG